MCNQYLARFYLSQYRYLYKNIPQASRGHVRGPSSGAVTGLATVELERHSVESESYYAGSSELSSFESLILIPETSWHVNLACPNQTTVFNLIASSGRVSHCAICSHGPVPRSWPLSAPFLGPDLTRRV